MKYKTDNGGIASKDGKKKRFDCRVSTWNTRLSQIGRIYNGKDALDSLIIVTRELSGTYDYIPKIFDKRIKFPEMKIYIFTERHEQEKLKWLLRKYPTIRGWYIDGITYTCVLLKSSNEHTVMIDYNPFGKTMKKYRQAYAFGIKSSKAYHDMFCRLSDKFHIDKVLRDVRL